VVPGSLVRRARFSDVDEDVRQSLARINASPFIPNKSSVRGFVYQVEDGRLREVL
jgi:carbonic anhydrase